MCEPGFVLPLCTPCAPGFFAALANATQCQPCPQHTFSELYAAVTCARCPYTTFTPSVGADACTPCTQANASYLETDPAACAVGNPAYNNIVAMGIGMVFFIAMLVTLCRYYAIRKKIQHIYFCEALRKRDQQRYRQIHTTTQNNNDDDANDNDADVMLRVSQDIEDNQSDDLNLIIESTEPTAAEKTAPAAPDGTAARSAPTTRAAELPRHSAMHAP